MIISASRRTDIPAFYAEWFMNRVREGHLFVQNPFNAHRFARVDLSPSNVEVILFWTKDPAPLLRYLDELDTMGYRYYFQFTLTAHPKLIEQSLPDEENLLATFRDLSARIGAERVIWRFDPILVSDVTPEDDIIERFARLAGRLSGQTERVVMSFAHFYRTVKGRLNKVQKETGVNFYDISDHSRRIYRIAREMVSIAHSNSIDITSCAEKLDLAECGIGHGRCVDDRLIKRVFGITVSSLKDRYQREQCQCVGSQDIGQYDTCLHDCLYCYANANQSRVHRNKALHDPKSPFLIKRSDEPTGPGTGKTPEPLQS
jgi:DNA repair photolyase